MSCQTTQSTTNIKDNNSNFENSLTDLPMIKKKYEENRELKVGLLLPMKGEHYRIGKSLLNAVHLALNKTKNNNIKIFVRDTSSTEGITRAYYEFLDKQVSVILGPVFSDKVGELKSLSFNSDIQIITFSNNINISKKNVYMSGLSIKNEIEAILEYSEKNDHVNFGMIIPENIYGNNIVKYFEYLTLDKNINIISKVFYDPMNPDFYEVAMSISDYENRNKNLLEKIELLKQSNTDENKKQIKLLKKNDTLGDLKFDSLFIAVENFNQLSLLSSTLPYYDVDPKKVQYFGTSLWNKEAVIKEPGLNNSIFTSLEKDKLNIFNKLYKSSYNENPHPIAIYGFDAIGIIASLDNQNLKISEENLVNEFGFNGLSGMFRFNNNGIIDRNLELYRIKNEQIIKVKN